MGAVSRRAMLGGLGAAALSAPLLSACTGSSPTQAASGAPGLHATVAQWVGSRPGSYQIAHRGSGDVYPEHSLPAYRYALDSGAQAMEISVVVTSDDVLICLHDLTYDRTTTGRGAVAAQPTSVLAGIGIDAPQLGPGWSTPPLTAVPRLADALDLLGGRVVLCMEAKDDRAYEPMIAMIEQRGLQDSVIVKAYRTSPRIQAAQRAGYPVFVYLAPTDMTAEVITATAARLQRTRDYLVLPATTGDDRTYFADSLIRTAVSTGVPVWVYPIHRRADAAHYAALGVSGSVSSSIAYTSGTTTPARSDDWAAKKVSAGQVYRQPDAPAEAPRWTGADVLTLDRHDGNQQFVTLGQFCPVPAASGTYTITFDARWDVLPADPASNLSLAFGHTDDAYYEHQLGVSEGYHAILRPDGRLQLYRHRAGVKAGTLLATTSTGRAVAGAWQSLRLVVTPDRLSWSSLSGRPATVTAPDASVRGGYLHVGRSAYDDRVSLSVRRFAVQ